MSKKTRLTLYPKKGKFTESEWNFMNRYGELRFGDDISDVQRDGHALYASLARNGKSPEQQKIDIASEMDRMKKLILEKQKAAYQKWFAPKQKKNESGDTASDASSSSSSSSSSGASSSSSSSRGASSSSSSSSATLSSSVPSRKLNDEIVFEKYKKSTRKAASAASANNDDVVVRPKGGPIQDKRRDEIAKLKVGIKLRFGFLHVSYFSNLQVLFSSRESQSYGHRPLW